MEGFGRTGHGNSHNVVDMMSPLISPLRHTPAFTSRYSPITTVRYAAFATFRHLFFRCYASLFIFDIFADVVASRAACAFIAIAAAMLTSRDITNISLMPAPLMLLSRHLLCRLLRHAYAYYADSHAIFDEQQWYDRITHVAGSNDQRFHYFDAILYAISDAAMLLLFLRHFALRRSFR